MNGEQKPQDPLKARFAEYRRFCERLHFTNVAEGARVWIEWLQTTANLLALNRKNSDYVELLRTDALKRLEELPKVLEWGRK